MGLDVRVYQDVRLVDEGDDYSFEAMVVDEDWNERIKNLKNGALYDGTLVGNFISYAYSAHNRFRESLSELIGLGKNGWENGNGKLDRETPFYEFFEFADNEGCMDFETSQNLFNDFELFENLATKSLDAYFIDNYNSWKQVFKLGKENGVVVFR